MKKIVLSLLERCRWLWAVPALGLAVLQPLKAQNFTSHNHAANIGNECYRLTQDLNNQRGLIWHTNRLNLMHPFDIVVSAYFGDTDINGADGIVFILQRDTDSTSAIGGIGGNLAMSGINPSFSVEFDTYQNTVFTWDPAADHIDVFRDGNLGVSLLSNPVVLPDIEDDACHLLRFVWNPGTSRFTVYMDDMNTPRVDMFYDLIGSVFGGDPANVLMGFSSATGDKTNEHLLAPLITDLGPREMTLCHTPETLYVEGSGNFTWGTSPSLSGTLSCTTCPNPVATPTASGYYTVTSNVSCSNAHLDQCSYTDTIFVLDTCCNSCDDFLNPQHSAPAFELVESTGLGEGNSCCFRVDLMNPQFVAPPKFLCSYYGFRLYPLGSSQPLVDYFDPEVDLYDLWGTFYNNFDHSVFDFCVDQSAFVNGELTVRFEFLDMYGEVICGSLTQTIHTCFSEDCDCDKLFNLGIENEPVIEVSEFALEDGFCCFRMDPFIDVDYFGCNFFGWRVYATNSDDSLMYYHDPDSAVQMFGAGGFDLSQTEFCIPQGDFASGGIEVSVEYLDDEGKVICRAHTQTLECNYCTCEDIEGSYELKPAVSSSGDCCWDLVIKNDGDCYMPIPEVRVQYAGSSPQKLGVFDITAGANWGYSNPMGGPIGVLAPTNGSVIMNPGASITVATLCLSPGEASESIAIELAYDTDGDGFPNCGNLAPPVELSCESPLCCDSICDTAVVNGDFEETNLTHPIPVGFQTDYEFRMSLFNSAGDVAVVSNANQANPAFVGTPKSGNKMLVVDGSTTPGQAFWKQNIPVQPFKDYCLTFWVKNVINNPNKPQVQVKINGIPLELSLANDTTDTTFVSPSFTDGWVKVCAKWNSGPLSMINMSMFDLSTEFAGNDFAIDNIVFGRDCSSDKWYGEGYMEGQGMMLFGNVPNPFNGHTQFHYFLDTESHVKITVYNIMGRQVAVVGDMWQAAGVQVMELDASGWASGVYIYTIEVQNEQGGQTVTSRMVISE